MARSADRGAASSRYLCQHKALGCQWRLTRRVLDMVGAGCVDMNAVHIDQARRRAPTQAMQVKLDAFLDDMVVPAAGARLAAQDELNRGIQQLERLCPLVGLLGVVLLCHLADLPGAPDFVSERPVFDLRKHVSKCLTRGWLGTEAAHVVRLLMTILTAQVGVVAVPIRVAILKPAES